MKAKTTIDERIKQKKEQISNLQGRNNSYVVKTAVMAEWIRKNNELINKKVAQIRRLEAKKARQQKDQAIGDKLVESGVITEENRKVIESLPQEWHNRYEAEAD